ncbi:ABC transporter ATP-binding protein [Nitratidesulfovibrio vulgaris]|uniref:ABC transporter related protein n=1 Tax=Nitratidesulfovibrio vulgaris (strain DP4) TaxID=391774 RepID=A0A0H3ABA1_NITV4|nr:ABC transporter ATP-binding protein [Nitratidesulfovibrio vulgaris]ABM29597.1 ABC transporter related protein [Nitratidesulfovibrio vulgaris DP4]
MIELRNINKSYPLSRCGRREILHNASITFRPGVNMGILGLNGQGKSTLIRIISGAESPDSGTVTRKGRVSWPIGFTGGFNGSLTGRENLRFTCRIYGADIRGVTNFVEAFSELGPYMDMPVKTYSSGMRSKLAFGLSMAIGFDFYLIDEAYSVGDASFQAKAEKVFKERKAQATLIVVSHSVATIRKNCDRAAVLHNGVLSEYETLDDALRVYAETCNVGH